MFVLGQLVQNVAGRRDRIGPVEQILAAQSTGRDQSPGQRLVAHDVAIRSRLQLRRVDLVTLPERFGRFTERPTRTQCRFVRGGDVGLLAEFILDESQRGIQRSAEQPVHQPHRKKVLAAVGDLGTQSVGGDRIPGQLSHRHFEQPIPLHDHVGVQRIRVDLRQLEILFGEPVLVGDQDPALPQVLQVGHERRGVHHHQRVQGVSGREDFLLCELHLKTADAGAGPPRGADFRREIGKRRNVIPRQGTGVG